MIQFSTAARVAHDLGLAACFGGTLFGKGVFNPSVGVVRSKPERGKIGSTTWNRFIALSTASFVVAVAWPARRRGMADGGWICGLVASYSQRTS